MVNEHLIARSEPPRPGEPAPDFTLPDQDRKEWTLSRARINGDVVLCFYPMSFTSVCGTEMECLTREMSRWTAVGAQMVGISCDSFAVQRAWADQMGFKQPLLADMHRAVCRAYGLYWPDLNVAWRGTVVVGRDGLVRWSQKREIKSAMNLDEVLAAIG
ncbi:MAG: redoxin domain-containing protein [Phycisphaerae bacterium]|nr:redoxin domain-containing protein [Phycisphaerae bacterium]